MEKCLKTNALSMTEIRNTTNSISNKIVKNPKLIEKFLKFKENIEVNMDSNKQW